MKCPIKATSRAIFLAWLTATVTGCVAPATPVTTVWQKLGIPQTGARLRDSTLNRSGNFPGLEKKPPLLKLADPANMAPDKPPVVQTAAKIKADQDMKKQKIKALKFLGDVNCGCYNKDKAVEKAFLSALDDCDPDVRKAAVAAIDKTISNCAQCRNACEATCCTEDLYKKLNDMAYGVQDGCYKEPVQEIRCAAAAVTKKCGCFKPNPVEELPAPEPDEPEELHNPEQPEAEVDNSEGKLNTPGVPKNSGEGQSDSPGDERESVKAREEVGSATRNFHLSDDEDSFAYGLEDNPKVVVADTARFTMSDKGELRKVSVETKKVSVPAKNKVTTKVAEPSRDAHATTTGPERITNPERLVSGKVVEYRGALGELLVELPDSFQLNEGWTMVVVDGHGEQSFAKITECGGRRLLLTLEDVNSLSLARNKPLKLGLVDTK